MTFRDGPHCLIEGIPHRGNCDFGLDEVLPINLILAIRANCFETILHLLQVGPDVVQEIDRLAKHDHHFLFSSVWLALAYRQNTTRLTSGMRKSKKCDAGHSLRMRAYVCACCQ